MIHALITGGTGSLGSKLVEKLIDNDDVNKVIVYSRDEHKQEKLHRYLSKHQNAYKLRFFIGDVRDKDRLRLAMNGVSHVIHTAALKIVPAMEYNPQEAIKTNINGTENVMTVAGEKGVHRATLVSTDKAVYPLNLYGATKLCAEKLTLSLNNVFPGTCFDVVRYGNVAMSAGSVIPLFYAQRANKEPLTVTSLEMTRFWITLDDAANFVIDRALMPLANVRGVIYVPWMDAYSMEDMVNIFSTDGVKNNIIGIRPGEKLHENILTDTEVGRATFIYPPNGQIPYIGVHPMDFKSADFKQVVMEVRSNTAPRIGLSELNLRIEALLQ